ncbi:hypothetical protein WJX73_003318 [Symbiochloris irregularis]|uniref:Histone-binding protein RBBP4 N-terminal domain-containing protein n=1 Tax=Symbiochloris irregularis TaxID=706552 RepID=A0AAW1PHU5_9CHLO
MAATSGGPTTVERKQATLQMFNTWSQRAQLLYRWLLLHNCQRSSITCRWSQSSHVHPDIPGGANTVLSSEREIDREWPNTLTLCSEPCIQDEEALRQSHLDDSGKALQAKIHAQTWPKSHESVVKRIVHPGQVNRIREVGAPGHESRVVTHTDAPELFVWNVSSQPARSPQSTQADTWRPVPSVADLVLTGHTAAAEYALATSSSLEPCIASGGQDTRVLLWNLRDHDSGSAPASKRQKVSASSRSQAKAPQLAARIQLEGHKGNINDLRFKQDSSEQLVSAADDGQVHVWDVRSTTQPCSTIGPEGASRGVLCVAWSPHEEHTVACGLDSGEVHLYDLRKLEPVGDGAQHRAKLRLAWHTASCENLDWDPLHRDFLASSAWDGRLCIWDLGQSRTDPVPETVSGGGRSTRHGPDRPEPPPQLRLEHLGNQDQVSDFHWHPTSPHTMLSVSDTNRGSMLQLWQARPQIFG